MAKVLTEQTRPIRLGGMLCTLVEPQRGHEVAYNRWYERDHFYAGCMIGADCFAGGRFVATFTPIPLPDDVPEGVQGDVGRDRFVQLYFLDEDPRPVWEERFASVGSELAESGLGEVVFASPFLRTVPGTDTYTDQLW